ncbi:MAG: BlaI/MecI/CopY family transcriptional regulator [Acidobacteriota bacterium]
MKRSLPKLSRFELQCLRLLWVEGEATMRQIHAKIEDPPSYSTVRKIFERLQGKGAVERVRRQGKAWVYRSAVKPTAMIHKEIRQFLDSLFDGAAAPLVRHLAEMDAVSLADLRNMEELLEREEATTAHEGRGRALRDRAGRGAEVKRTGSGEGGENPC